MFAIVVNEKGGEQKRLEFDKPEVTIGRVQGNDIILPKGNVSKRHSRIVLKDGKFIIVDLKSTNGTYVNGRKITSPLVVKGSDKIYIGDFILSIEELQAGAAASDEGAAAPARKSATVPPPPPRRNTTGDYAAEAEAGADGDEGDDEDSEQQETPSPPERLARPTLPPSPEPARPAYQPNASVPSIPASAIPPAAPRPAPAPRSPSRIDLPAQRPATGAQPIAQEAPQFRPAPAAAPSATRPPSGLQPVPAAARAAAAPVARPQPAPAPARRPIVAPVDDGKRGRITEVMRELSTRLAAALGVDSGNVDATQEEDLWSRAESAASDLVEQLSSDGAVPPGVDTAALLKDVVAETVGTGPLDEWLSDENVREVAITRFDRVYLDKGGQLQLANKWFSSAEALNRVVERLLARHGRQAELHAARSGSSLVETRLDGGVVFSAALPPIAARGPVVTIRRPKRSSAKLGELVSDGVLSQGQADWIESTLKSRKNLVVSGPDAAGRAALVGALGRLFVEWGERVVTVEEAEELDLGEGAHVALVGKGPSARHALAAATRMRPDRLILADLRGPESLDMIAALAAGGDGGVCSVQAASPRDAIQRIVSLARLAPEAPSVEVLREEAGRSVQAIVQLGRGPDGEPHVSEIAEVADGELSPVSAR